MTEVLLLEGNQRGTPLRENKKGFIVCPSCGHDDVAMWADDGEADLADWWQCEKFSGGCGSTGAVVYAGDTSRTLNGCAVVQS